MVRRRVTFLSGYDVFGGSTVTVMSALTGDVCSVHIKEECAGSFGSLCAQLQAQRANFPFLIFFVLHTDWAVMIQWRTAPIGLA